MNRFFSDRYSTLVPYVPGEQPSGNDFIKLNTNESPYPPSPGVAAAVAAACDGLRLYSDPDCDALRCALGDIYGVSPEETVMSNGSDEALYLAFTAFADERRPLIFPDITYGFYPVYARLGGIPFKTAPLRDDFTIDCEAYYGCGRTVVIANPNAPTGIYLTPAEIEGIVKSNPDNVVIIDEAYIDFGGESAVPLTKKYDNLLVIGTFSKSRSMAGVRLGFAIGNKELIACVNAIRYSINPYNVNRLTAAAGLAALRENGYYMANCAAIRETRERTEEALRGLGFAVTPSLANFVFAASPEIGGEALYAGLKKRGILVRHFASRRISSYNRITVGTAAQMDRLIDGIKEILTESKR